MNSGITGKTVRVIHAYLNETYRKISNNPPDNFEQMLLDLASVDDGILDGVHAIRNQYGADIVDLWVDVRGTLHNRYDIFCSLHSMPRYSSHP
jgi:hypothetical protein